MADHVPPDDNRTEEQSQPKATHLEILQRGVEEWNAWRREIRVRPDLRGADLRGTNLRGANLGWTHLTKANLSATNLQEAYLVGANLGGASLREAKLSEANLERASLYEADLGGADLEGAWFRGAKLARANLRRSVLIRANLSGAYLGWADVRESDLREASLVGADLNWADFRGADLRAASLLLARLRGTDLTGARIYGASVWDVETDDDTKQTGLVITTEDQPDIVVDDLEVAQFMYLLLKNEKIRNVIQTITSKVVLILGRFCEKRKAVLDSLREELRKRGFSPVVFDFKGPTNRDLTETVQLLANMARFVIADVTDAKSIPQELSHIIPFLPSVPVQPIILASEYEYAMFEHWRRFNSVLPAFRYENQSALIESIESAVLTPVKEWEQGYDRAKVLEERVIALEEENRQLKADSGD